MPNNISKVLVIIASPVYNQDHRSNLINILCKEFLDAIQQRDVEIDLIDLYQENFEDLIHRPEADKTKIILNFQQKISENQLIVFFHPIWWGDFPAILKGFIESVLHKGFAYKYHRKFLKPLLQDKKMMVITTGTKAEWFYRFIEKDRLYLFWKRILQYKTGIKLVKFIRFTEIRSVSEAKINKWKEKVIKLTYKIGKPKKTE